MRNTTKLEEYLLRTGYAPVSNHSEFKEHATSDRYGFVSEFQMKTYKRVYGGREFEVKIVIWNKGD